jgi:hypothetical protein
MRLERNDRPMLPRMFPHINRRAAAGFDHAKVDAAFFA